MVVNRRIHGELVLLRLLCLFIASVCGFQSADGALLELVVQPTFRGEPLRIDALMYETSARETISVTRLSYLLSGFALETAEGKWTEFPDQYAWMDAANRRMQVELKDIPAGKYRAIRFDLGLDPETNKAKPEQWPAGHPLNPNLNGLHWSWQGGYIFLALEGHYQVGSNEVKGYALHLARDPNRVRINLTAPLDLNHDLEALVDFDIASLFNAPRVLSLEKEGASTHSRDGDPVSAALVSNLPGAFQVKQIVSKLPSISRPSEVRPLYLPEKYTPYRLVISNTFPIPDLPRDNPLIEETVALGRKLFHETALSRDDTLSCASCHQPEAALSDKRRFSIGVDGQIGTRNGMPLFNLAWKNSFFWDGRAPRLRDQVLVPIQDHVEMDEKLDRVVAKLKAKKEYPPMFEAAFGTPEITSEKLGLALEQFMLTLVSHRSKFDRAMRGEEQFTPEESRGFELFMTENEPRMGQRGADCFHCHGGALFSDHQFHNNGLSAESGDFGRYRVTNAESDRGKFSTPSLRNVALTAPYMHDGRFSTLEQVIDHYSSGVVRSSTLDPNLAKHPPEGMQMSAEDKKALVAFLKTLTDDGFAERVK